MATGTAQHALTKQIEDAERKAREAADKLKQLKARQAAIDARQKAIEAKRALAVEKQRKVDVGGLVKLAGLLGLDNATLLGALLAEADRLSDAGYAAAAKVRGEAALAQSKSP